MSKKLGIAIVFIGAYLGLLGSLTWLMCAPLELERYIGLTDWLYGLLVSIALIVGAALSFKRPFIGGIIALTCSIWYFALFGFGQTSYGLVVYLILVGAIFATLGSIIILLRSEHSRDIVATGITSAIILGVLGFMILPVVDMQEIYTTNLGITYVSNYYKISYFDIIFGTQGNAPSALGIVSFIFMLLSLGLVWGILFIKNKLIKFILQLSCVVLLVFQVISSSMTWELFVQGGGQEITQAVASGNLFTSSMVFSFASPIAIGVSVAISLAIASQVGLTIFEKFHPYVKPEKTLFDI